MTTTPDWVTQETDRRIYELAEDEVITAWGSGGVARLGPVIYRALLSQAILDIIVAQTKAPVLGDATIRRLVAGSEAWIDSKIRR
jgi:hypothetical protein